VRRALAAGERERAGGCLLDGLVCLAASTGPGASSPELSVGCDAECASIVCAMVGTAFGSIGAWERGFKCAGAAFARGDLVWPEEDDEAAGAAAEVGPRNTASISCWMALGVSAYAVPRAARI